jgi:hypothetical protein
MNNQLGYNFVTGSKWVSKSGDRTRIHLAVKKRIDALLEDYPEVRNTESTILAKILSTRVRIYARTHLCSGINLPECQEEHPCGLSVWNFLREMAKKLYASQLYNNDRILKAGNSYPTPRIARELIEVFHFLLLWPDPDDREIAIFRNYLDRLFYKQTIKQHKKLIERAEKLKEKYK